MRIRGFQVDLNVYDYLKSKRLGKLNRNGDEAKACCPFHSERTPSFGVNLETGQYHCFGCGEGGSFSRLVKELDGFSTVFEAEQFLIAAYGRFAVGPLDEPLELDFTETTELFKDYFIDDAVLEQFKFRNPYLGNRGVSEKWQRLFEIGYSKRQSAVTFPYRDEFGRLVTIKLRSVLSKSFWYEPAMPERIKAQTFYGLDKVLKWKLPVIALTEAEIDCISVWQAERIGAIAIGGNQFTDEQAEKLVRLFPEHTEFVVFTDNDNGGSTARAKITAKLAGRFPLSEVSWSRITRPVKDANDLELDEIVGLIESRVPIGLELNLRER